MTPNPQDWMVEQEPPNFMSVEVTSLARYGVAQAICVLVGKSAIASQC